MICGVEVKNANKRKTPTFLYLTRMWELGFIYEVD